MSNDTTTTRTGGEPRALLRHPDGTAIRILVDDDERTLTDLLQMALRY
jgi:two-component system OmpR family response regulator